MTKEKENLSYSNFFSKRYLVLEHEEKKNRTVQLLFTLNSCKDQKIDKACSISTIDVGRKTYIEKVSLVRGQTVYYKCTHIKGEKTNKLPKNESRKERAKKKKIAKEKKREKERKTERKKKKSRKKEKKIFF